MMGIRLEDLSPEMQAKVKEKYGTEKKKKSKYGNERTATNGIKFDSKKEARRYMELRQLETMGKISDLKLQHTFTLQEAFTTESGDRIQAIKYIADFTYMEDGKFVVEDVKSPATRSNPVYRMKNKMMAEKGYVIREI